MGTVTAVHRAPTGIGSMFHLDSPGHFAPPGRHASMRTAVTRGLYVSRRGGSCVTHHRSLHRSGIPVPGQAAEALQTRSASMTEGVEGPGQRARGALMPPCAARFSSRHMLATRTGGQTGSSKRSSLVRSGSTLPRKSGFQAELSSFRMASVLGARCPTPAHMTRSVSWSRT